jgi:hypothetical protein
MKTDGASLLGICSDLLEFTRRFYPAGAVGSHW